MTSRIMTLTGFALAGFLTIFLSLNNVQAEDKTGQLVMQPGHVMSLKLGSKQTVTYFEKTGGSCTLTIMVGEAEAHIGSQYISATRVKVSLDPGKTTNIDNAQGQSLRFMCNSDASSVGVSRSTLELKSQAKS